VQKAKLDILENLPDIEINEAGAEALEARVADVPVIGNGWTIKKLLLIGAPLFVVLLLVGGLLLFYPGGKVISQHDRQSVALVQKTEKKDLAVKSPAAAKDLAVKSPAVTVVEFAKTNRVSFRDFVIDLKDKTGKSRILMCDVALDVNEEKNIAELERGQTARNVIYQTVKGKNAVALRSIEERKRLKKELSVELNKLFGEGIVKNLYFTSFIII
jgi:flagellar basal body-associated protein FliL